MSSLTGKSMVVIGGSRGVGRHIVEEGLRGGARVLAVARQDGPLRQLQHDSSAVEILALDATAEDAPAKVFAVLDPDILVIGGGVFPSAGPLHRQSWQEFAVNWESDVKIAFHFLKAALTRPLRAGTAIVLLSSGAALAGSPNTGGYAGAKRTQLFIANYAQKESDRLKLGLHVMSLAPRIMPDTELGKQAVTGYAGYLGISEAAFLQSMAAPPTPADVATAAIELSTHPREHQGKVFIVSGNGFEVAPC